MKGWLGLDVVDLLVHVALTSFALMLGIGIVEGAGDMVMGATVLGGSVLAFAYRRRAALRKRDELTPTGEERLAELASRVAELELEQDRLLELEERLDFAERLLASRRESKEIGA